MHKYIRANNTAAQTRQSEQPEGVNFFTSTVQNTMNLLIIPTVQYSR